MINIFYPSPLVKTLIPECKNFVSARPSCLFALVLIFEGGHPYTCLETADEGTLGAEGKDFADLRGGVFRSAEHVGGGIVFPVYDDPCKIGSHNLESYISCTGSQELFCLERGKPMDIHTLQYFKTICEELSFRKAAERLHISQPSLSAAMRKMEEEMDITLLHRDNKGVRITPEGAVFYKEACLVLKQIEDGYSSKMWKALFHHSLWRCQQVNPPCGTLTAPSTL